MFEKLKSNLCHPGTLCLSWACTVFFELVSKKNILMNKSSLMEKYTIVPVMSLGHKTEVLITVLSPFGRFNIMWRSHLVFFIFPRYKHWYKTCSKITEFNTTIFTKEHWWMYRELFGTLWKIVPELLFGPQTFDFTPRGLWNVLF